MICGVIMSVVLGNTVVDSLVQYRDCVQIQITISQIWYPIQARDLNVSRVYHTHNVIFIVSIHPFLHALSPMAGEEDAKTAIWTAADDTTLVHTLADQKAAGNWGDNNPKKKAWTACEEKLVGSEKRSGGLPKVGNTLRN
jgi:hypothetical protein